MDTEDLQKMTVAKLRELLKEKGKDTAGRKAELIARLVATAVEDAKDAPASSNESVEASSESADGDVKLVAVKSPIDIVAEKAEAAKESGVLIDMVTGSNDEGNDNNGDADGTASKNSSDTSKPSGDDDAVENPKNAENDVENTEKDVCTSGEAVQNDEKEAEPESAGEEDNSPGPTRVFISNFPWWTTDDDLKSLLSANTTSGVKSVEIHEDVRNGKSKGRATVDFNEPGGARRVIRKLNSTKFEGRELRAEYDERGSSKRSSSKDSRRREGDDVPNAGSSSTSRKRQRSRSRERDRDRSRRRDRSRERSSRSGRSGRGSSSSKSRRSHDQGGANPQWQGWGQQPGWGGQWNGQQWQAQGWQGPQWQGQGWNQAYQQGGRSSRR
jgi:transformer-2 protein